MQTPWRALVASEELYWANKCFDPEYFNSMYLCLALPCTTSRPSAVRLILVPGRFAAHTYTPECCRETSEIIRFPVPSTWIPSTPMERPSDGHTEIVCEIKLKTCCVLLTSPPIIRWYLACSKKQLASGFLWRCTPRWPSDGQ